MCYVGIEHVSGIEYVLCGYRVCVGSYVSVAHKVHRVGVAINTLHDESDDERSRQRLQTNLLPQLLSEASLTRNVARPPEHVLA